MVKASKHGLFNYFLDLEDRTGLINNLTTILADYSENLLLVVSAFGFVDAYAKEPFADRWP